MQGSSLVLCIGDCLVESFLFLLLKGLNELILLYLQLNPRLFVIIKEGIKKRHGVCVEVETAFFLFILVFCRGVMIVDYSTRLIFELSGCFWRGSCFFFLRFFL